MPIKEYQNLFKAIFEQSAFPMQIFGVQGDLLESNQAWEIMFQTSREEARGYNIFQDPQIINSPVLQGLKKALRGETVELEAFFMILKNQEILAEQDGLRHVFILFLTAIEMSKKLLLFIKM
jgi:PAS domain S-box-containing protein